MNVFGANMVYQPPKVRAQIELRARRASGYLASDSPPLPAKHILCLEIALHGDGSV